MVTVIGVAGAITAALTAAVLLWARARRLQRELSRIRVQRAFEWVVTGRAPQDLAPETPEQRRAGFYLIRGGGAALASLLGARVAAALRHVREHPALTTTTLTALTAVCVILVLAAVHSDPSSHAVPARPPATASLPPTAGPRPRRPSPTTATTPPSSLTTTPSWWPTTGRQPASSDPTPGATTTAAMSTAPISGTPPVESTPVPSSPTPGTGTSGSPVPSEPALIDTSCLVDLRLVRVLEVALCAPAGPLTPSR